MLTVLSLGAGVQSSTLALMLSRGDLTPAPTCAVFADTQAEPKAVYEWLSWLEPQLSFPVLRASRGNLWAAASRVRTTRDGQRSYIETAIPVFTADGPKLGRGRRSCTRDFKVSVVQHECRKLLGKRQIRRDSGVLVRMLLGISLDEAHRMRTSREHWIENSYPLVEAGLTREDCLRWCRETYGVTPPRSACTFCPFRSDEQWRALTSEEFRDAADKERELQAAYRESSELDSTPFFHVSRTPLAEAIAKAPIGVTKPSLFGNDCEGMCGV